GVSHTVRWDATDVPLLPTAHLRLTVTDAFGGQDTAETSTALVFSNAPTGMLSPITAASGVRNVNSVPVSFQAQDPSGDAQTLSVSLAFGLGHAPTSWHAASLASGSGATVGLSGAG